MAVTKVVRSLESSLGIVGRIPPDVGGLGGLVLLQSTLVGTTQSMLVLSEAFLEGLPAPVLRQTISRDVALRSMTRGVSTIIPILRILPILIDRQRRRTLVNGCTASHLCISVAT